MTQYTCPMHPEILRDEAGDCPICGMALEPLVPIVEKGSGLDATRPDPFSDLKKRLIASFFLTLPLFIISMFHIEIGALTHWVQLSLATPVVLWGGWPFFRKGWESFKSGRLNMFSLVALGTGAAYLYSIVGIFLPQFFPTSFKSETGQVPVYFEAAAVIIFFVLLGQILELRAREKTGEAITSLLSLAPNEATVLKEDGVEESVPICHVKVGDRVRVHPGERIPIDGILLDGRSEVDESMMTGEPLPVLKKMNDGVRAGTLNGSGSFVMRAEQVGEDTQLSHIVHMVAEAQRSRAPIQKLADRVSSIFVPIVIVVAVMTFFLWGFLLSHQGWVFGLINAVAVLLIACPCALGLATPVSIMVGTGRGALEGIFFKNAESLDLLSKINTLVIDKTGTLTEGKPSVLHIHSQTFFGEDNVLTLAASLEKASEHPLAAGVLKKAEEKQLKIPEPQNFQSFPGQGVTGAVNDKEVYVGNKTLFENLKVRLDPLMEKARPYEAEGNTLLFVGIQMRPIGFIVMSDQVKPSSKELVRHLQKSNVDVVMLTGDHDQAAERVAKELGIKNYVARVSPEEKAIHVKKFKEEGRLVAMAGDGINDAPALAEAHVGIAMGTGTDIAIQTAGVTLMKGDLRALVKAIDLSRATMRNIKQNLFFAFFYNTLGVPIAAGLLYPFYGVLISPMLAGAMMSFSSVSVLFNALRLKKVRI